MVQWLRSLTSTAGFQVRKLLRLGCPFCILAVCGVLYCGISSLCVGLYTWLLMVVVPFGFA